MDLNDFFADALAPIEFEHNGKKYYARRLTSIKKFDGEVKEGETDAEANDRRINARVQNHAAKKDGTRVFSDSPEHYQFIATELPYDLKGAYINAVLGKLPNVQSTPTQDASSGSESLSVNLSENSANSTSAN
jgi:hypothetical protein